MTRIRYIAYAGDKSGAFFFSSTSSCLMSCLGFFSKMRRVKRTSGAKSMIDRPIRFSLKKISSGALTTTKQENVMKQPSMNLTKPSSSFRRKAFPSRKPVRAMYVMREMAPSIEERRKNVFTKMIKPMKNGNGMILRLFKRVTKLLNRIIINL